MAADMALQVVVSPFLGVVFDNLSSLIRKEVGRQWGVDKEMKKLSSTLSTIQAVLADAEEKQLTSKAIANWLVKIKKAAYVADDILDEWASEALELDMEAEHKTNTKQVCRSFLSCFSFEQIKFRHKMAKRVDDLTARFDEIADEKTKFHLREGAVERKLDRRETSSILTEPIIYGRDKETEEVVGLLLDNKNGHEHLSIFPILGIGGLGKTTFAQGVYNDERVAKHFDLRIWICVSDDFDVKRLSQAVLESVSGGPSNIRALDPLQRSLQEKLSGKRFLLVLDDVWNENQEEWNRFKSSLSCGAQGSSVIVTTRILTVASITGTRPPYDLKLLSEDDCWSLFKQRAFGMGNEEKANLVKIGMEIVKKCGGVPLAAKALGGALRFKDEKIDWLFVRDSEVWDLPLRDTDSILPALRLSYTHLPPYVRQCFTYCSIFPKDYRINKKEVIHLWIANSLVQSRDNMDLEDMGNEIFNSLLWRSLFQDVEERWDGSITVKMHDLVHDLVCSISLNECYRVGKRSQIMNVPQGTMHLLFDELKNPLCEIHQSAPNLRTLIVLRFVTDIPNDYMLSRLTFLRALSLQGLDATLLPNSMGNLKHLRYFKLSYAYRLTSLPETIYELRNLRTLILKNCPRLRTLPKLVSSLRHLRMLGCNMLTEMPIGMGKLTCLQTLSFFIVSLDNRRGIKELKGLNHLRGKLEIRGLEHVTSLGDAKEAHLMRKQSLERLGLIWSKSRLEDVNDIDVAEGLQPHPNIKGLLIEYYQGLTLPKWLDHCSSSLPSLVVLNLQSCRRCEYLPSSLGNLLLLKRLNISGMNCVKYFFNDHDIMVNGFPSLEYLALYDMSELEDWCSSTTTTESSGVERQVNLLLLRSLKWLDITFCPKLKRLPLSPLLSLEALYLKECHDMILARPLNLPRLSHLTIYGFKETIYLPEGMLENLPALQSLIIGECKKLKSLQHLDSEGSRELTSLSLVDIPEFSSPLQSLHLEDLPSLTSLPSWMGCLTNSLKHLMIDKCPRLKRLPLSPLSSLERLDLRESHDAILAILRNLPRLTYLQISGFKETIYFPEGTFENLPALQVLVIGWCKKLKTLPTELTNLSSLCHLKIEDCGEMTSLSQVDGIPEFAYTLQRLRLSGLSSLTSLPTWMGSLTNLQALCIHHCHPALDYE